MSVTRRKFIEMMGAVGGAAAAYHAMTSMGFAQGSENIIPDLQGSGKGTSVLILGAGLAGMSAAYELNKIGYDVTILEYSDRAGGRCWTLRGGDTYTEMGGETQKVQFREGNYLNPGPWRIPYHHRNYLTYARQFGVQLEPFIQVNENAFIHRRGPGKKYRIREVRADFYGYTAELLSKAIHAGGLDAEFSGDDADIMTEALAEWGSLDDAGKYVKSMVASEKRGYAVDPGARLQAGEPSDLIPRAELLQGDYWKNVVDGLVYEHQQAIFQPVGGMDAMARAFEQRVGNLITYGAKVNKITSTDSGVTATYTAGDGRTLEAKGDYCICTIPLSILSQIDMQMDGDLPAAVKKVPYAASFKAGIEASRFWETEDHIYGGISYTDLPISVISYPSEGQLVQDTGVCLAAYQFGPNALKYSGMTPEARLNEVRKQFAEIHPQAKDTYLSGASVGWHRVPWSLGCYGVYTDEQRKDVYKTICARHGRLMLAGEHTSYWPGWQEGAFLGGLTAVEEIHKAAQAG